MATKSVFFPSSGHTSCSEVNGGVKCASVWNDWIQWNTEESAVASDFYRLIWIANGGRRRAGWGCEVPQASELLRKQHQLLF